MKVAGVPVSPAPTPTPFWWAHLVGCAWVAAWLTVRGREMLAPRELLLDASWRGELISGGQRPVVHRPDLIGVVPGRRPAAIEVELARKAKGRLRAILSLHASWIASARSGACVYVCRDDPVRELVVAQAKQVGLHVANGTLRVELLETIKQLALNGGSEVGTAGGVSEAA